MIMIAGGKGGQHQGHRKHWPRCSEQSKRPGRTVADRQLAGGGARRRGGDARSGVSFRGRGGNRRPTAHSSLCARAWGHSGVSAPRPLPASLPAVLWLGNVPGPQRFFAGPCSRRARNSGRPANYAPCCRGSPVASLQHPEAGGGRAQRAGGVRASRPGTRADAGGPAGAGVGRGRRSDRGARRRRRPAPQGNPDWDASIGWPR